MKDRKHRIGTIAVFIFVGCALIADLIGLIPFAKDFTATIFWGVSMYALHKKGVSAFNGSKLGAMVISWAAGMIPVIQELPIEITAGIVAIIFISRLEERTGLKTRGSLNSGGRREPEQDPESRRNQNFRPAVLDGVRAPRAENNVTAIDLRP